MDERIKRRIIPVNKYKHFDLDGWSEDSLMGLVIDKTGVIRDARLGDLNNDGLFYDVDGASIRATHLLMLKLGDFRIGDFLSIKKNVLWYPGDSQIKALERVSKKLPENKELKELLNGLKRYARTAKQTPQTR